MPDLSSPAHKSCHPLTHEPPDATAKMGGLLEQISGSLDAEVQQPERVRAAVLALHALCKIFEFKPTERRKPVNEVNLHRSINSLLSGNENYNTICSLK